MFVSTGKAGATLQVLFQIPRRDAERYFLLGYVRSGYIPLSVGYLSFSGIRSYDWSSQPYSTTNYAYFLGSDAVGIGPSSRDARWVGFPLRCLAD